MISTAGPDTVRHGPKRQWAARVTGPPTDNWLEPVPPMELYEKPRHLDQAIQNCPDWRGFSFPLWHCPTSFRPGDCRK
ncbi:hypothetical protein PROPHIGD05-3_38 [Mycobacterium phage prophiGD05-3]|nr:hypothetical protein PROPHIGD05-3_38 [Mycobacterium phage prophiGD05-3]